MSQTTFPERLRMALAADQRQDQQIATAARVAEGQLSRWKNGHVVPELPSVQNLVRELGISGHWLLTGEGPMRPDSQADALKLEVIGLIVDEEVDPLSIRQFAESVRGLTRDDAQAQIETEALARGVSQRHASPAESDGSDAADHPEDPAKDGTNGPPDTTRHVGP